MVMPDEKPPPEAGTQPDSVTGPQPEPDSTPQPEPPKPQPPPAGPPPTADEVAKLTAALTAARTALTSGNPDAATRELAKADNLPMLPEHRAKFQRLQSLTQHAKSFREAVSEALSSFRPGDLISVGSSTEVTVVKSSADSITVTIKGKSQTYSLDQMPSGLTLGIADAWLSKKNPSSLRAEGRLPGHVEGR